MYFEDTWLKSSFSLPLTYLRVSLCFRSGTKETKRLEQTPPAAQPQDKASPSLPLSEKTPFRSFSGPQPQLSLQVGVPVLVKGPLVCRKRRVPSLTPKRVFTLRSSSPRYARVTRNV